MVKKGLGREWCSIPRVCGFASWFKGEDKLEGGVMVEEGGGGGRELLFV